MLSVLKGMLRDRRHTQEFLTLRTTLMGIYQLIFAENEMTGAIVRMKTGLRLTELWRIA